MAVGYDRDDRVHHLDGSSATVPRWLLLLVAVLFAGVVGLTAGILAAALGEASPSSAVWTGAIAFGSTIVLMLTVLTFLVGDRSP